MNKKVVWGIVVVIVIIIIALVWQGQKPTETGPIKIGFIGPLTGENGAIGEGIKNGIVLSSNKYKNVQVIFEDDQFNTRLGVTAFNKLTNVDKVNAIINTTPGVADAISPILKDRPLPVIQIAEPGDNKDDTIFQIMPSGAALYEELGKLAKKSFNSLTFIYQNNPTFEKAAQAFKSGFGQGVEIISTNPSNDYRSLLTKIINGKKDAITIVSSPSIGVPLAKQFFELNGRQIKLLCNGDMEVTIADYLKAIRPESFEGCKSTFFSSETSQEFKEQYKKAFQTDPTFGSDYAYDAVDLIVGTYSKNLDNWIRNIKSFRGRGVSGEIIFNENGVRLPKIDVHQFQSGKFVRIES